MSVKSVDLRDQKLLDVISDVLRSGQFINGPYVDKFSKAFAKYCGSKYCIPVSSGTDAISLVLKALMITGNFPDDKIIIPNLSFFSTASAIVSCEYTPIYCDVDENGLLDVDICIDLLDKYNDIACVIPVNLYGQYVNIPQFIRDKVPIIDDACQAHGLFGHGSFSGGSKSLASCYSFYPSKNLGAIGDAGAIVTNDKGTYEITRLLANYGSIEHKHHHAFPEYSGNYRMDEIQAAVLYHKLKYTDFNIRKSEIAKLYYENDIISYARSLPNVFHQYPILVDDRKEFIGLMEWKGIDIGIHYPYILPDKVPGIVEGYSVSKLIADHCVSLPIGSHLTDDDLLHVVTAFRSIVEERKESDIFDNMYVVKKEL